MGASKGAIAVAIGGVGLMMGSSAAAQAVGDKYWLRAGGYYAAVDSSVQVSGNAGRIGSDIDFESDLALEDKRFLPSFTAGADLGGGWSLNVDVYTLKREGTVTLDREVVVDDVVYPLNASLTSGFRSTTGRIAAGYSFSRSDTHDVGATLGIHMTDFSVFVQGQGSVGGAGASAERRARSLLAPLPTIGLYARFEPAPKLTLSAKGDLLKLKISDYTGSLVNLEASASYRVAKNVGIGAMYRYVDYSIDVNKDYWSGGVAYRFSGPLVFFELGF